jgi:outer membrane protein OmpA-like peptidoglycan-associated protein
MIGMVLKINKLNNLSKIMRNLILGISILCLALSGLIIFKALNLPEKKTHNSASQPSIKTHEHSQDIIDTVPEPNRKQDQRPNVNQTLQNKISHLEQKLENNIAYSQMNIQTLEDSVKQLEQKLTDKDNASQTYIQSAKNTIAQLEQKLVDKIAYSQINIQALENTVKQLEHKLLNKDKASQSYTQSAENITPKLEHTPAPHKNTPQNILEIGKPENTEKSLGQLLFNLDFRPNNFVINDKTTKLIQQSSQYILSLPPNYCVIVEGHTDNIPIKTTSEKCLIKDNISLSLIRAKTIAGIFEKEGISSKRISAIGYGDSRPIASNNTVKGRAKNRRVVVRLIPEEKER